MISRARGDFWRYRVGVSIRNIIWNFFYNGYFRKLLNTFIGKQYLFCCVKRVKVYCDEAGVEVTLCH